MFVVYEVEITRVASKKVSYRGKDARVPKHFADIFMTAFRRMSRATAIVTDGGVRHRCRIGRFVVNIYASE